MPERKKGIVTAAPEIPSLVSKSPRRPFWRNFLWHLVALALSAIFLVPLASMLAGALRKRGLPPSRTIDWLPNPIAWENYTGVFQVVDLGRFLLNTSVVELMAVPTTLLVASWAGFALCQLPVRFSRRVIAVALLAWLLPETALWVSRFILYKYTGIIDTPFALSAVSLMGTSPLYMFIFYWTFRRVPVETWEAARIDGAGAFRTWWSVGVPVARSAFAAVGVLTFVYYWREFRDALLYIQTAEKYTVSMGLAYLDQLNPTDWPLLLTGSVIVTAPLVLILVVSQPVFLEPVSRVRRANPGDEQGSAAPRD
jgi:multiple sugar transport system permease protein